MKPYQQRLKDFQQQIEFTDGRMAVGVLLDTINAKSITHEQLETLYTEGKLQTGVTYKVTDALATQAATYPIITKTSVAIYLYAINTTTFLDIAWWERQTFLPAFGWSEVVTMAGADTITAVNVNGVNQLTAVIPFVTDITTTVTNTVNNINANPVATVVASQIRGRLVLEAKQAGTTANGHVIDIVGTGTFAEGAAQKKQAMINGVAATTHGYEVVYDITTDNIVEVRDNVRDFILQKGFTTASQRALYSFRYEDSTWTYNNTKCEHLEIDNAHFGTLRIDFGRTEKDGRLHMNNNAIKGNMQLFSHVLDNTYMYFTGNKSDGVNVVMYGIYGQRGFIEYLDNNINLSGGAFSIIEQMHTRASSRISGQNINATFRVDKTIYSGNNTVATNKLLDLTTNTWNNTLFMQQCFIDDLSQFKVNNCTFSSSLVLNSTHFIAGSRMLYDSITVSAVQDFTNMVFSNNPQNLTITDGTVIRQWLSGHIKGVDMEHIKTVTGVSYNAIPRDKNVLLDTTANVVDVVLPTGASVTFGNYSHMQNFVWYLGANAASLSTSDGATINGVASPYTFAVLKDSVSLIYNAANTDWVAV